LTNGDFGQGENLV